MTAVTGFLIWRKLLNRYGVWKFHAPFFALCKGKNAPEHVECVGILVSCANLLEKQAKVCYAENTTNCTRRRAKFMEKRYDDEKQMV